MHFRYFRSKSHAFAPSCFFSCFFSDLFPKLDFTPFCFPMQGGPISDINGSRVTHLYPAIYRTPHFTSFISNGKDGPPDVFVVDSPIVFVCSKRGKFSIQWRCWLKAMRCGSVEMVEIFRYVKCGKWTRHVYVPNSQSMYGILIYLHLPLILIYISQMLNIYLVLSIWCIGNETILSCSSGILVFSLIFIRFRGGLKLLCGPYVDYCLVVRMMQCAKCCYPFV